MKIGDVVMFTDKGTYAKWFYGRVAIVEDYRKKEDGEVFCKVRWLQPVPYFDKMASISSFNARKFSIQK